MPICTPGSAACSGGSSEGARIPLTRPSFGGRAYAVVGGGGRVPVTEGEQGDTVDYAAHVVCVLLYYVLCVTL